MPEINPREKLPPLPTKIRFERTEVKRQSPTRTLLIFALLILFVAFSGWKAFSSINLFLQSMSQEITRQDAQKTNEKKHPTPKPDPREIPISTQ